MCDIENMPDRDYILDNVSSFEPQDLALFISKGRVTLDDLRTKTNGQFAASKRKEVERILDKLNNADDIDWDRACQEGTIEAYLNYLKNYPSGKHRREANVAVKELKDKGADQESEEEWRRINRSSKKALQDFVSNFPQSPHCKEAKDIIADIEDEEEFDTFDIDSLVDQIKYLLSKKGDYSDAVVEKICSAIQDERVSVDQFYEAVRQDKNLISPYILRELHKKHIISIKDFCVHTRIPREIVQEAKESTTFPSFASPEQITKPIERMCTEVYFWGVPSSGKTCALGGILSVANSGKAGDGMYMDMNCQGYGYMNRLSTLFSKSGVIALPGGTPTDAIYEMGFDLTDSDNRVHPITCIDLAGELFEALYLQAAGDDLSEAQEKALEQLDLILVSQKSGNRKIHFFVVEYGAHDKEFKGVSQASLLNAGMGYINERNVFDDSTDGVFIIVTKVDKIKEKNKSEIIDQYLRDNYRGFYMNLKNLVKRCEINGGKGSVEIALFSLGKVCLQKYCIFNEKPSCNIVNIILNRSKGFKQGKFYNALRELKK